jgi:hypothetical protein
MLLVEHHCEPIKKQGYLALRQIALRLDKAALNL